MEFPEELERNNYIEAIASRYQVGFDNMRQMVNHLGTKGGIISEREPQRLKSGVQKKKTREDGMMQSQRLLLTWLVERPQIYAAIRDYIEPADFTEGIYETVARELFTQFAEGGELNPARIVSLFSDEESQRQVAEIFNTNVQGMETDADWEKAIRETLVRIKQNSMEQRRRNLDPTDMNGLKQIIDDKRRLQEMEKLHISFK